MNNVTPLASTHSGDIDLLDLCQRLWRHRLLVLGITVVCAAAGWLYAQVAKPVFETSSVLRPVALNELDALNRSGFYSLSPAQAFNTVGAALDSYEVRLAFFKARPELLRQFTEPGKSAEQAFDAFNKQALALIQPDSKKSDLLSAYVGIRLRYGQGLDGANVLNDFVAYAVERERLRLSNDFKVILGNRLAEVDAKLNWAMEHYSEAKNSQIARLEESDAIQRADLEDELTGLRVQLRMRREARLAQLAEAIAIAKSLGLEKPSTPALMANQVSAQANIIRTEVNSQQAPLYFLGSQVLEAERDALNRRASDDFMDPRIAQIGKELVMLATNRKVQVLKGRENEAAFLEGIESLSAEKTRLLGIDPGLHGLRLVRVDQPAIEHANPIRPRKALILLVAATVGLLLGVVVALVNSFFSDRDGQLLRGYGQSTPEPATSLTLDNSGHSRLARAQMNN